jgi:hypothetical protein
MDKTSTHGEDSPMTHTETAALDAKVCAGCEAMTWILYAALIGAAFWVSLAMWVLL